MACTQGSGRTANGVVASVSAKRAATERAWRLSFLNRAKLRAWPRNRTVTGPS